MQHQAVRERQAMRLHGVPRAWNGTARGLTGLGGGTTAAPAARRAPPPAARPPQAGGEEGNGSGEEQGRDGQRVERGEGRMGRVMASPLGPRPQPHGGRSATQPRCCPGRARTVVEVPHVRVVEIGHGLRHGGQAALLLTSSRRDTLTARGVAILREFGHCEGRGHFERGVGLVRGVVSGTGRDNLERAWPL